VVWAVAVGDDDAIVLGKFGNLANGHGQVFKLLGYRTFFSLADKRIAAQGYQQRRFPIVFHHPLLDFQGFF